MKPIQQWLASLKCSTPPSRKKLLRIALLFVLMFSSLLNGEAHEIASSVFQSKKKLEMQISPAMRGSKGALIIGITDGHKHQIYSFGSLSNRENRKPNENTIFELGSVTKIFTALLLADLRRDGVLSLKDPARKFLPEDVVVPDFHGKQITLFQLATHSSGLPRDPDNLNSNSELYSREQFHAFLRRYTLKNAPGSSYSYSNTGFTLLGECLETASGSSFENLLQQRILIPLRMISTKTKLDASAIKELAQGHDKNGNELKNSPKTGGSTGGLKSNAHDLLLLLDAAICQGKSAISTDITETCKFSFPVSKSESACMGWFHDRDQGRYGKSGQVDGFSSYIGFSPSRHAGIVVLSSTLQLDAEDIVRKAKL